MIMTSTTNEQDDERGILYIHEQITRNLNRYELYRRYEGPMDNYYPMVNVHVFLGLLLLQPLRFVI